MKCIALVYYSVSINGVRGESFPLIKGLYQGEPLSPFLFLICSEGLPLLMRLKSREGTLLGAWTTCSGPRISHLFFTDDFILFGEVTLQGVGVLKDVLTAMKVV